MLIVRLRSRRAENMRLLLATNCQRADLRHREDDSLKEE